MLFKPATPPPQDVRHYCRYPRCRSKLHSPALSALDAFCTPGCVRGFFRTRCRVCERSFERKNEREKTCGRRECLKALKRDPVRFSGSRWGDAPVGNMPSRSTRKSGVKSAPQDGSTVWSVITGSTPSKANLIVPLDPDLIARLARHPAHVLMAELDAKARRRATRAATFKKRTSPLNVLGGFGFADAPAVDLSSIAPPAAVSQATHTSWTPVTTAAGCDLSIPDFLKRPSTTSRPVMDKEGPPPMPGDGPNNLGR